MIQYRRPTALKITFTRNIMSHVFTRDITIRHLITTTNTVHHTSILYILDPEC